MLGAVTGAHGPAGGPPQRAKPCLTHLSGRRSCCCLAPTLFAATACRCSGRQALLAGRAGSGNSPASSCLASLPPAASEANRAASLQPFPCPKAAARGLPSCPPHAARGEGKFGASSGGFLRKRGGAAPHPGRTEGRSAGEEKGNKHRAHLEGLSVSVPWGNSLEDKFRA